MSQQPYQQPPQQPYGQPQQPYYPPQGYYPPPPVTVNVTQNAGGRIIVRRRVRHGLHATLTFLTGGLWAIVWYLTVRSSRR
jgi:hypothetical protein